MSDAFHNVTAGNLYQENKGLSICTYVYSAINFTLSLVCLSKLRTAVAIGEQLQLCNSACV